MAAARLNALIAAATALLLTSLSACGGPPAPQRAAVAGNPGCNHGDDPPPTFIVFFDWNTDRLKQNSAPFIHQAIANAKQPDIGEIDIAGFTDQSGSADYNQALSLRRARVVAKLLMQNGIAGANIKVSGYGDTRPVAPAAPGVKNPVNCNVSIQLHKKLPVACAGS